MTGSNVTQIFFYKFTVVDQEEIWRRWKVSAVFSLLITVLEQRRKEGKQKQ